MMPKRVLHRLSIRQQIALLALVAFLPATLLLGMALLQEQQRSERAAKDHLRLMAEDVAHGLDATLHRAHGQLMRLAARPQVRALEASHCDPLIASYVQFNPEFKGVLVRDLQGRVLCNYMPKAAEGPVPVQEPWFSQALASEGLTVSGGLIGQISQRWIAVLSVPIHDVRGGTAGLLRSALDLAKVNEALMQERPRQALIAVVDQDGKVLLRSEALAHHIGRPLPQSVASGAALAGFAPPSAAASDAALAARPSPSALEGFFHALDQEGVAQVFYTRAVADGAWRLYVSLPEEALFAEHRSRMQRHLALSAVALGMALALAAYLGRGIVQPLAAITESLNAEGKRLGIPPEKLADCGEIERVGVQLSQLLAARQASDDALRFSEASYRDLVQHSPDLIASIDRSGRFTFVNNASEAIFGLPAADCIGQTALNFAHVDDREPTLQALRAWLDAGGCRGLALGEPPGGALRAGALVAMAYLGHARCLRPGAKLELHWSRCQRGA